MKGSWTRKYPSVLKEQRRPMSQKLLKEEKAMRRWFAELKSVPLDQECRAEVKCSPTASPTAEWKGSRSCRDLEIFRKNMASLLRFLGRSGIVSKDPSWAEKLEHAIWFAFPSLTSLPTSFCKYWRWASLTWFWKKIKCHHKAGSSCPLYWISKLLPTPGVLGHFCRHQCRFSLLLSVEEFPFPDWLSSYYSLSKVSWRPNFDGLYLALKVIL